MKVKTSELTGISLDYAVALASGAEAFQSDDIRWFFTLHGDTYVLSNGWGGMSYQPSDNWVIGGPIIEQEGITVCHGSPVHGLEWLACDRSSTHIQHGPSYLIAAMRCFCTIKLGEEVELPEKLK